ncbi:NAD(P)/FAD-dependent oxidoreductase [Enterococcus xiangfangensis]|uniref:NAD(P)/FAD-dependent oxidoreductase n=1 Tax=Enterococcus xiangfangensis TaxID=1296537 RepID=UPI0010FA00CE|nr:NAD(P)/FAD-dependent oxidoreductase [Enterococcus xiangfangensis]MBM7712790.1 putative Rossmann fold flavoprotein [Enterococcus xiangfangensis]NBK09654.1 NAD(P)/FAD-dependent oxidoreductase [Enterococcus asini]
MKKFDVIVVGGGPSGMMAAITAALNGAKVALFEKNKRLGKKLLMTGGGRCNVTNNRPVDDLITHIPGNGRFLYSTFSQFDNQDVMRFFSERGVALKEEDHGRIFPVSDKSATIVNTLKEELEKLAVTLFFKEPIEKIITDGTVIQGVRTAEGDYSAKSVIITTGGITYPSTGSQGDGYRFAKSLGHHVTPLYPTESPIFLTDDFIADKILQGLSLQDVKLTVVDEKNKTIASHEMDLLFTHFGISGPAALRCSSFVNQLLRTQKTATLVLDCFPNKTDRELLTEITDYSATSTKQLKNALTGFLPERLLLYFLSKVGISDQTYNQTSKEQLDAFVSYCKNWSLTANKTFGLEKSFVTGGGVELKEVNPKELASKKIPGLYFAGEVLDVNGYTGGYNITTAFCTGYVAGTHAAYHTFS